MFLWVISCCTGADKGLTYVDKDISWFTAHDDRLGHTRVGATDPENARALYGLNVSFSAKRPEEKVDMRNRCED